LAAFGRFSLSGRFSFSGEISEAIQSKLSFILKEE
jgi:hypothetical protein